MCPKCNQNSWDNAGEFPKCVICGYENYQKERAIPKYRDWKKRGVKYYAPYVGNNNNLKELVAIVWIKNRYRGAKDSIMLEVTCPWCSGTMESRINNRYECNDKHVLKIKKGSSDDLHWE